ncbi:MAG: hypothetical protein B7733_19235 [Myxococcales bacterium FL481]|nr:MAG: hypothetical protein B7733_19235 [Myxococcales bacterium FL481]
MDSISYNRGGERGTFGKVDKHGLCAGAKPRCLHVGEERSAHAFGLACDGGPAGMFIVIAPLS